MKCNVGGCTKKHHAHGYCSMHATRLRRTGDPLAVKRTSTIDSFWRRVNKTDTCWLWTGSVSRDGYGTLATRLSPVASGTSWAHRVSYELAKGPIPAGLQLDHLCRITGCVNPDHLEPVTPRENTRRGLHGVLRTHCSRGHELVGENLRSCARGNIRGCRTCAHDSARRIRQARSAEGPMLAAEVRQLLGISHSTLQRWTNAGVLTCDQSRPEGAHRRFDRKYIEALAADPDKIASAREAYRGIGGPR